MTLFSPQIRDRALSRDPSVIHDIVDRRNTFVQKALHQLNGDVELAETAADEVLLRIDFVLKSDSLPKAWHDHEGLDKWTWRVHRNCVREQRRKLKKIEKVWDEGNQMMESQISHYTHMRSALAAEGIREAVAQTAHKALFDQLLNLVARHDTEYLTATDLARELSIETGLSLGTCKNRISKLKKELGPKIRL